MSSSHSQKIVGQRFGRFIFVTKHCPQFLIHPPLGFLTEQMRDSQRLLMLLAIVWVHGLQKAVRRARKRMIKNSRQSKED